MTFLRPMHWNPPQYLTLWTRLIPPRLSSVSIVRAICSTGGARSRGTGMWRVSVTTSTILTGGQPWLPTRGSCRCRLQTVSQLPGSQWRADNFPPPDWWVQLFISPPPLTLPNRYLLMYIVTTASMTTLSPSCSWPGASSRITTSLSPRRLTKSLRRISTVVQVHWFPFVQF